MNKFSRPISPHKTPFDRHFPACAGSLDHVFQSAQVSPWPRFSAFASPPLVAFLSLREPASGHALEYARPPLGHRFPTRTLTLWLFILGALPHLRSPLPGLLPIRSSLPVMPFCLYYFENKKETEGDQSPVASLTWPSSDILPCRSLSDMRKNL